MQDRRHVWGWLITTVASTCKARFVFANSYKAKHKQSTKPLANEMGIRGKCYCHDMLSSGEHVSSDGMRGSLSEEEVFGDQPSRTKYSITEAL